jgi:hypothetical protein
MMQTTTNSHRFVQNNLSRGIFCPICDEGLFALLEAFFAHSSFPSRSVVQRRAMVSSLLTFHQSPPLSSPACLFSLCFSSGEGHCFCEPCIMEWLRNNQTCPMSRHPLTQSQLGPNRFARDLVIIPTPQMRRNPAVQINDLEVRCPSSHADCPWIGSLSSEKSHLATCDYATVQCEHEGRGCAFRGERRSIYFAILSCLV